MAISNDIQVVMARFDGTYEEFDLPSHSNARNYSRKLIRVPSGGKYKILLGANKDFARDSGYAFEIYHGMRLKATAMLDFRKVHASREELVHVPEDRQEPYLFPSHDPRRSGDDQSVIRVEVKHFKVNGIGAKKFLSRGHYVFTGNQLPGRVTDHRLIAKLEFILGNVNYLPPLQAIGTVRNQISTEAAPARTQVQRQTTDTTTTTRSDESTKHVQGEAIHDELSHRCLDNQHQSVKQSQQSTAPIVPPQLPTTKVAAIVGTITGGDAPDEYTGLGKGFEDKDPEPSQAPDSSDSTANSGSNNGGRGRTGDEQLAARHKNDIGRRVKELFAYDMTTRGTTSYAANAVCASVGILANAVAGSRAATTAGRTVSAAANVTNTREDRNGSTPTAPVRRDTTSGVQRFHPYTESNSSIQSARPATNAAGSSAGSLAPDVADRGSEWH